jgi:hypothetical protein
MQINDLVYIAKRRIRLGSIDTNAPQLTIFAVTGGKHFSADFNQIVAKAFFTNNIGDLIDAIAFGN